MANALAYAAEKKAFSLVLDQAIKTASKEGGYIKVLNVAEKFLGDTWGHEAFDRLRVHLHLEKNMRISLTVFSVMWIRM